ncbi:MAG: hypothetical protein A3B96_00215 [Candidatus Spechtbacteria bacterium RIFCSPHIGHO2_02_FULL_43_15b]|uniref:TVP38/TMEM64 family membrane protein n=1 Tax=Candidatus Spechtbacteria bacterium RIFCSPHIGHO2_01_FULL_43_30 TaxID=1802158 RepID=A0A1G2H804_9BACT|nr:MAG: hypothetical protein A2827_02550 [Candidatus Spechtbacteria bacterium RIFCSPHIGHO2_01_FULL_43_30]OGZ58706.1 MAG: hypothetical protein A3B96_00215 [Candidatus Spechtbacteria bacterium RIFCSPHIGHO2_02_FULL_43_15b]
MNNLKKTYNLMIVGFVAVATLAVYIWAIRQDFFQDFIVWSQQNFTLYFCILVLIKFIGIVWPPIPGGILTLGSIPVIGWFNAYLADIIGGISGACAAYFLGKRYGYAILRKLFDEPVINRISSIKISKKKEIEAIFILRLFTGSISEAVSYGCGLMKISFRNFAIGTFAASVFLIPIFYIAEDLLSGKRILLHISTIIIVGFIFYKLRGRYFE